MGGANLGNDFITWSCNWEINPPICKGIKLMKTVVHVLGVSPGGASSALKVPGGPLINITAFYSPNFVWPLFWGINTKKFSLGHPCLASPLPCSKPAAPWVVWILLHGAEANVRVWDIPAGNSQGGMDKGVATPSVTAEAERRTGTELFLGILEHHQHKGR